MIGVILIVVSITLIVSSIIEWNKDIKRIKELEDRLNQYYEEREQRLIKEIKSKIKKNK